MKSVLLSIKPKWCELIASGEKKIEVRKTAPKLETPFKCYIYCTKNGKRGIAAYESAYLNEKGDVKNGSGKVIGEFVCTHLLKHSAELWDDETYEDIRYLWVDSEGEEQFQIIASSDEYTWKQNRFTECSKISIEELRNYLGKGIHEFYGWQIGGVTIYDEPKELSEFRSPWAEPRKDSTCTVSHKIEKAPQSWCYVEELEETKK